MAADKVCAPCYKKHAKPTPGGEVTTDSISDLRFCVCCNRTSESSSCEYCVGYGRSGKTIPKSLYDAFLDSRVNFCPKCCTLCCSHSLGVIFTEVTSSDQRICDTCLEKGKLDPPETRQCPGCQRAVEFTHSKQTLCQQCYRASSKRYLKAREYKRLRKKYNRGGIAVKFSCCNLDSLVGEASELDVRRGYAHVKLATRAPCSCAVRPNLKVVWPPDATITRISESSVDAVVYFASYFKGSA